jgi:hypothetical protein
MAKKIETKLSELTLSDGRKAALVEAAKGRHATKASMISGGNTENIPAAIACQVISIDGALLTMEDILELPIVDYFAVVGLVMGAGGNDLLALSK